MKALTKTEAEAILKARGYVDTKAEGWWVHNIGRAFKLTEIEGQEHCEVERSEVNRRETKKNGVTWNVSQDHDLWGVYEGMVEMDGDIYLLQLASSKRNEELSNRRGESDEVTA